MVILKIPIVYLCFVVYYAIKADAEAGGRRERDGAARARTTSPGAAAARPRPPSARGRMAARPAPTADAAHGRRQGGAPMNAAEPTRSRPSDSIAGYLAAMSIFICLIGLAWHPLRLILPGIVVAMVAAGMGGRHQRLAFAAVLIAAACFFFGMMIAVDHAALALVIRRSLLQQ